MELSHFFDFSASDPLNMFNGFKGLVGSGRGGWARGWQLGVKGGMRVNTLAEALPPGSQRF